MESANWKWAPHAEGNHRVNRNQKDRANPVGTRQELITRGNYCLDHSLWHRILKHQQMCLECSAGGLVFPSLPTSLHALLSLKWEDLGEKGRLMGRVQSLSTKA